jgi:hypothetical protein
VGITQVVEVVVQSMEVEMDQLVQTVRLELAVQAAAVMAVSLQLENQGMLQGQMEQRTLAVEEELVEDGMKLLVETARAGEALEEMAAQV